jgi:nicotinate-nucleotide pyrophosphorylase (carboxylating)
MLDKLAVVHGGGRNHRVGLFDMILIKDNHITASGGVIAALANTHRMLDARGAVSSAWRSDQLKAQLEQPVTDRFSYGDDTALQGVPMRVQLEVATLDQLREALALGGADIIMLDNMVKVSRTSAAAAEEASAQWKEDQPGVWSRCHGGQHVTVDVRLVNEAVEMNKASAHPVELEASGNVVEDTVGAIAKTKVERVSCGALTHSVTALDISMKIKVRQ